jgi:hypothetical protein
MRQFMNVRQNGRTRRGDGNCKELGSSRARRHHGVNGEGQLPIIGFGPRPDSARLVSRVLLVSQPLQCAANRKFYIIDPENFS